MKPTVMKIHDEHVTEQSLIGQHVKGDMNLNTISVKLVKLGSKWGKVVH